MYWKYLAEKGSRYCGHVPVKVLAVMDNDEERGMGFVHHVKVHSPTGMQMGYGGSGPADMALSILYHYFLNKDFDEDQALAEATKLHQDFKWDFVAKAVTNLEITSEQIGKWVTERTKSD